MADARYTFLLPAYKGCYLRNAIQSILGQSFASFKILISDDASPEPLQEIADSFHDARITFRRNDSNLGAGRLVQHWNMLLKDCHSEYVIIASDDDLYDPRFLEEMETLSREHPEADILRARARIIDQDGKEIRTERPDGKMLSTGEFLDHLIRPGSVLCVGNYSFKTATLKNAGGFVSFPLGWKSDSATQILLSRNGMPCTEDVLFSFRMSGINISSRVEPDREKDHTKLDALLAFDDWAVRHLEPQELETHQAALRDRLQGESRSYLWTLSCPEFWKLYGKFQREHWFRSFRNRLSFLLCWIKRHDA